MLALLWKDTQEILSYFLFLSSHSYLCPSTPIFRLAFCNNKIHLPISGAETRGYASTQHAPLRGRSRLSQHLSVMKSFSNYNSHITHGSQYIQMHTLTHHSFWYMHTSTRIFSSFIEGLSMGSWWPFSVALICRLLGRVWQVASGYTLCTAKPPNNDNVMKLIIVIATY